MALPEAAPAHGRLVRVVIKISSGVTVYLELSRPKTFYADIASTKDEESSHDRHRGEAILQLFLPRASV
jgi:hypothetical protein